MEKTRQKLIALESGRRAEEDAARYLEARGWRIMARRFRVRGGEIDLVALEPGGVMAFVEVKGRRAGSLDDGRGSVTRAKRRRIQHAARVFLVRRGQRAPPCRFDVITVVLGPGSDRVRHYPGAFELP